MFIRSAAPGKSPQIDIESRMIDLSFSSEAPITRNLFFLGEIDEVLIHTKESMDTRRVKKRVCPFLDSHDTSLRLGRVLKTEIDESGKYKTGRASIRISKTSRGDDLIAEIEDDTFGGISVGYLPRTIETIKEPEFDQETWRQTKKGLVHVTEWELLEISYASVPADTSVGMRKGDLPDTIEISGLSDRFIEMRRSQVGSPEDSGVILMNNSRPIYPVGFGRSSNNNGGSSSVASSSGNNSGNNSGSGDAALDVLTRQVETLSNKVDTLTNEGRAKDQQISTLEKRLKETEQMTAIAKKYAEHRRGADALLKDGRLTRAEYSRLFSETADDDLSIDPETDRGEAIAKIASRNDFREEFLDIAKDRSPALPTERTVDIDEYPIDGESVSDEWVSTTMDTYKLPSLY